MAPCSWDPMGNVGVGMRLGHAPEAVVPSGLCGENHSRSWCPGIVSWAGRQCKGLWILPVLVFNGNNLQAGNLANGTRLPNRLFELMQLEKRRCKKKLYEP